MPDWAREVRARLSSLRLGPEREVEIVEELSQHLEDRCRELIADGVPPDEAVRLTLAGLRDGDRLARWLAPLRQAQTPPPIAAGAPSSVGHRLGDLWQDLRYARRTLAATPGFTLVAILSLALGIGANTAIFSVWHGVLHASLPVVHQPEQLVMLTNPDESGRWTGRWNGRTDGPRAWLTYSEFEHLRDHADRFSSLMASQSSLPTWQVRVDRAAPEEARGRLVTGGFFEVLGVRPAIGRVFTADDDRGDASSAVISYDYWQRRFGGRRDVLGTTLAVRKAALSIIGVAPRGFIGETSAQQPDFWLPARMQPLLMLERDWLHDSPPDKVMWLHAFGRLKPGVTLAQADAQANAVFQADLESFYGAVAPAERRREFLDQHLRLQPAAGGASPMRADLSPSLTTLFAAVGVVLLIASANLANLLLARGAARRSEMALRISLGASRARLMRQLVTEGLTLAAAGAAAAIAVAYAFHAALVRMLAASDPRFAMRFEVDAVVLTFLLGATLAAALVFAVLPAWQVTRIDPRAGLDDQTRGTLGSRRQTRAGRWLVSLQLALSLPLLVGAGLLARTAYNLQRADLGFSAGRLLLVRVDLRELPPDSARRDRVRHELLDEFERIPGVGAATFSHLGLFSGGESSSTILVEGYTPKGERDRESARDFVGPRYFSTLGIPIHRGREIVEDDRGDAAKVCVINEAFAKRFFDGRNPIGLQVTSMDDGDRRTVYQVVGVAADAHTQGLRSGVEPRYFIPAAQSPSNAETPTFVIRATADTPLVLAAARRGVERTHAGLSIMSARSVDDQMTPMTAQDRTTAQLAMTFGSVALGLAAIGLYGVLSYGVARRTSEIAIRLALGAQAGRVTAMILRETLGTVGAGLLAGLGLAFAVSRLVESRLYGIAPRDPITLASATLVLLVVAFIAAFVPARRASRLDPIEALRHY